MCETTNNNVLSKRNLLLKTVIIIISIMNMQYPRDGCLQFLKVVLTVKISSIMPVLSLI